MSEPPIRQAIYGTTDAITRRAAWYRNLVICISVIGMTSIVMLIITWRPIFLAIGTLMLPAVAGWFYWDTRLVRRWSQKTLQVCRDGSLDVSVFTTTITAMKHLPEPTIQSMLIELERYRSILNEKKNQDQVVLKATREELRYLFMLILALAGCIGIGLGWWQVWPWSFWLGWLLWGLSPWFRKVA